MNVEQIRQGLKKPGKTQVGLAERLGINPSAVSRLLNGKRQLKAAEIAPTADYLESPASTQPKGQSAAVPAMGRADTIPVLGMGDGGDEGWSTWKGEVVDYVARPPSLVGAQHAYAVYVRGTSMEPRYHPGEMIFVHPDKPVTIGAYVLVQARAPADGDPPRALIRRLTKRTTLKLVLEQCGPPKTSELSAAALISIHRIVASGE